MLGVILMAKIYTLGVLGLGEGLSILSAAQTSPRWRTGNICDLREDVCMERRKGFGVPRSTTRYEELLADPAVDVIAIYTPDPFHATHIIQAFKAGKHVICTKPLFDGLDEAKSVYAAWKASGRKFLVGQSTRWGEPMLHQWTDYKAGKLGELWTIEAHYHHDHRHYMAESWAKDGIKWIYCGLSHPVDMVRRYFDDIDEVFGYGVQSSNSKALNQTGPDVLHFVLKCRSGKVAQVSGCYGLPTLTKDSQALDSLHNRDSLKTCILRGDHGTSRADYPDLRYSYNFGEEPSATVFFEEKRSYYYRFNKFGYHAGEFQNYLDAFAEELDGGSPALPDLPEGIVTIAVMRAMELSLERNRPVKVSEVLASYGLAELAR